MKRRDFLIGMAAMGGGAFNAISSTHKSAPGPNETHDRPNVLILLSDQHSPHVLGCYGDTVVRTPWLDGLARKGTIFENNYCASPLCVPSKSSLLTGLHPYENRTWANSDILPSDVSTFAHSLGATGYETTLIGHMHFCGPDQQHGFEKILLGSPNPQYPNCKPFLPSELMVGATCDSHAGVALAGPGRTAYGVFSEDVAKATAEYLRQRAGKQERPFCAMAGFLLPHPPFICPKQDWDYYLDRVVVPSVPPDYFNRLHPAVQLWRNHRGIDKVTPEETRRARAAYYGMVTELDRQIGIVLDALEETGLDKDTIVIYTSDHGEMAGENGMWWKMNMYEGSVSVPLIIACPNRLPADRRVKQITSLVDVRRTLELLAGAGQVQIGGGRNLVPLIHGETGGWVNEAFSEFPMTPYNEPAMRMIRQDQWKLVHFEGYRPQMFNLESDPHELHDLGDDPAYAAVRARLSARVLETWNIAEIERVMQSRRPHRQMIDRWSMVVKPPCPAQWVAPSNANTFPLPS